MYTVNCFQPRYFILSAEVLFSFTSIYKKIGETLYIRTNINQFSKYLPTIPSDYISLIWSIHFK